jgi:hypothetical protein
MTREETFIRDALPQIDVADRIRFRVVSETQHTPPEMSVSGDVPADFECTAEPLQSENS